MTTERLPRVLVVDDDLTISDVVLGYLRRAEMNVEHVGDGFAALEAVRSCAERGQAYDVIVLDLMLPGIDGLEVCRRMRAGGIDVPVLMLTARGDEQDRVLGLEVGADDYVAKPFSPRELVLRVRAILRRSGGSTRPERRPGHDVLTDDDLAVDLAARTVVLAGARLALTTREFDLLAFVVAHPGRAFTRQELMTRVWEWDFGDLSTVTVHVRRLRSKLEVDPAHPSRLVTVWGVGYRWDARVPAAVAGTAAGPP
ncbi:MAG: response regulator transcription factor [Candidatus Nanopelagicales bacterium]